MIRLLALDLDGTLIGSDLTVAARVKRAIGAAQARRVVVTLATGRMFEVAAPFARDLAITAPLICYQGALVRAVGSESPLLVTLMERPLMQEVLEWGTRRGWHLVFYSPAEAFALPQEHPDVFYDILSRERIVWVDSLPAVLDRHRPVKLIAIAEPIEADHIEAEMRERFGDRMAVVRSHTSVVEGSPPGVTKGEALRKLAAHLSIPQSQTMAIGDRDNDITMVAWAGLGVAMRDGSPALIKIADWVAPSVQDDGVAVAIERFLLNAAATACTSNYGAIAAGSSQPGRAVENALCPSP